MDTASSRNGIVPACTNYCETKLCIIVDSKTPIIMKVPTPPQHFTLGKFKATAQLKHDNYKYYFKATDSEFGVVKEEVVDDDSNLPVDGDRIVAWVLSTNDNQSRLFNHEDRSEDDMATESIRLSELKPASYSPFPNSISQGHPYTNQPYGQEHNLLILKVQLHLNNYNFLGLTLVGPSDGSSISEGGIYIGEIAKDSVVEQDGRILVGDRIVGINEHDIRNLKSDDAVATFKNCVDRRGAINLVLQRNTEDCSYSRGRFTLPRDYVHGMLYKQQISSPRSPQRSPRRFREEDLPIPNFDFESKQYCKPTPPPLPPFRLQGSFVRGTHSLPRSITPPSLYTSSNFKTQHNGSDTTLRIESRSVHDPPTPTSLRQFESPLHCINDDIRSIYTLLRNDIKSLDIKDREWLKVTIKDAFLGSTLVKWLTINVIGFNDRREVKRYANRMLCEGVIKNPISSGSFSEKCYYTLG